MNKLVTLALAILAIPVIVWIILGILLFTGWLGSKIKEKTELSDSASNMIAMTTMTTIAGMSVLAVGLSM